MEMERRIKVVKATLVRGRVRVRVRVRVRGRGRVRVRVRVRVWVWVTLPLALPPRLLRRARRVDRSERRLELPPLRELAHLVRVRELGLGFELGGSG